MFMATDRGYDRRIGECWDGMVVRIGGDSRVTINEVANG
jgi:hypothetical protein